VRFVYDYLTNTITLSKIPKDWFNRRMLLRRWHLRRLFQERNLARFKLEITASVFKPVTKVAEQVVGRL